MHAMTLHIWRRPRRRPHRSNGIEELVRAKVQLERLNEIAAAQEQVSSEVRERIETNHIAAALQRWITSRRPRA